MNERQNSVTVRDNRSSVSIIDSCQKCIEKAEKIAELSSRVSNMHFKIKSLSNPTVQNTSKRVVDKVMHDNELRDLFDECAISIQNKIKKRRLVNLRRSYYTIDKLDSAINTKSVSMLDTDKINLMHMLLSNDNVLILIRKLMFEGYKITKEMDPEDIAKIEKFKEQFKSRNTAAL